MYTSDFEFLLFTDTRTLIDHGNISTLRKRIERWGTTRLRMNSEVRGTRRTKRRVRFEEGVSWTPGNYVTQEGKEA